MLESIEKFLSGQAKTSPYDQLVKNYQKMISSAIKDSGDAEQAKATEAVENLLRQKLNEEEQKALSFVCSKMEGELKKEGNKNKNQATKIYFSLLTAKLKNDKELNKVCNEFASQINSSHTGPAILMRLAITNETPFEKIDFQQLLRAARKNSVLACTIFLDKFTSYIGNKGVKENFLYAEYCYAVYKNLSLWIPAQIPQLQKLMFQFFNAAQLKHAAGKLLTSQEIDAIYYYGVIFGQRKDLVTVGLGSGFGIEAKTGLPMEWNEFIPKYAEELKKNLVADNLLDNTTKETYLSYFPENFDKQKLKNANKTTENSWVEEKREDDVGYFHNQL